MLILPFPLFALREATSHQIVLLSPDVKTEVSECSHPLLKLSSDLKVDVIAYKFKDNPVTNQLPLSER